MECLSPTLPVEGAVWEAASLPRAWHPASWVGVCFELGQQGGCWTLTAFTYSPTQGGISHMTGILPKLLLVVLADNGKCTADFSLEVRLINTNSAQRLRSQPLYSTQTVPPCPLPRLPQHASFIMIICVCVLVEEQLSKQYSYLWRGRSLGLGVLIVGGQQLCLPLLDKDSFKCLI